MKKFGIIVLILGISTGCDLLGTDIPADEIPAELAIQSQQDLQDLLNSSYDVLANYTNGKSQRFAELLSDNIEGSNIVGGLQQVYNHNTNTFNESVEDIYKQPYFAIHRVNLLLESMDPIDMSEADRNQMTAEARFIRGISHFDAVRLMAHPPGFTSDNSHPGIPIRLETGADPVNRSTVDESYDAIIKDLRFAEDNLPTNNGIYATSYAAQGFLAKVYYLEQNYDSAIYYVNQVLGASTPFSLSGSNVNARYSQSITSEHIFYTLSNNSGDDNRSGEFISSYRSDINTPAYRITEELYNLGTANASDTRANWFDVITLEDGSNLYVTNKFNITFFNVALVHVVELLLTRAESYAINNTDLSLAIADVNAIRTRAGIAGISPISNQTQVLDAIRNERRIELSLEGDRIFELKRLGAEGENISVRGDSWDCNGMILQFPNEETFPGFELNPSGGC